MNTTFSSNIKQLRFRENLTQEEFAAKYKITRKKLGSYETGRVSRPDPEFIKKITGAHHISMEDLLQGEIPPPSDSGDIDNKIILTQQLMGKLKDQQQLMEKQKEMSLMITEMDKGIKKLMQQLGYSRGEATEGNKAQSDGTLNGTKLPQK